MASSNRQGNRESVEEVGGDDAKVEHTAILFE